MGVCYEDKSSENLNINNNKTENIIKVKSFIKPSITSEKIEKVKEDKSLKISNIYTNKTLKSKEEPKKYDKNNDFNLKNSLNSRYILKQIFSILDEKKKLSLIKYNKFYNKLFEINIEHYKSMSGRIKIGEKNGFGKEYELNKMTLVFKGYYLNGKKNGKGKEYKNDILIFEGEFLNGEKWKRN